MCEEDYARLEAVIGVKGPSKISIYRSLDPLIPFSIKLTLITKEVTYEHEEDYRCA